MGSRLTHLIDKARQRRALNRWAKLAEEARTVDLGTLRSMRGQARALRRHLDQVIHTAEERLTLPLIGSNAFRRPLGSDWTYRPQLWRGPISPPGASAVPTQTRIGDEVTVFHDCTVSELTVRQIRNTREADLAPYGLRLDVFRFDGSFQSLAIDLPGAAQGLQRRHLIRVDANIEMEKPLEIFARLNVRHGPNVEQVVRELPLHEEEVFAEFDLAYTKLNEKRVEHAWLDLIFDGPEMNQVILRDITFSRRPRAEL